MPNRRYRAFVEAAFRRALGSPRADLNVAAFRRATYVQRCADLKVAATRRKATGRFVEAAFRRALGSRRVPT